MSGRKKETDKIVEEVVEDLEKEAKRSDEKS